MSFSSQPLVAPSPLTMARASLQTTRVNLANSLASAVGSIGNVRAAFLGVKFISGGLFRAAATPTALTVPAPTLPTFATAPNEVAAALNAFK